MVKRDAAGARRGVAPFTSTLYVLDKSIYVFERFNLCSDLYEPLPDSKYELRSHSPDSTGPEVHVA